MLNQKEQQRFNKLIRNKQKKIDCSQDDSAFLKETVRRLTGSKRAKDSQILQSIERWFPCEWDEAFDGYNLNNSK